jgi:hypothetical protein
MDPHPDSAPDHTPPVPGGDDISRGLLNVGDVHALRRAEQVSLHAADGVGVIDASLTTVSGDEPRTYTATEQRLFSDGIGPDRRRRIEVAADVAGFDTDRRWHDHQLPGATASAILGSAQFHDVWRSVAAFLRVGDLLRLRWHAGNNTDELTACGLHRDDLRIELQRGARLWTFLLDVSVCAHDARMVTPAAHH